MTAGKQNIKKIPYGVSNYNRIVEIDHYYVDKTKYLERLDAASDYLFFVRPRRFGKSLFLSMVEAYYDIQYRDRFDELFGGTWIHGHPTAERNSYHLLTFNFSIVDPAPQKMEDSFFTHILERAMDFFGKYSASLEENKSEYLDLIKKSKSASDILSLTIAACKRSNLKLYVTVDEYDNFANTILSDAGKDEYRKLTRGSGFFRSFFNVLKAGTTGMNAPITKLLLTGVSPITLDDVTSGYNIGDNISADPNFRQMLGFTETDVETMLEYYRDAGLIHHDAPTILDTLKRWYGNYLFSKTPVANGYASPGERLFNTDMVLYFFKEYFKTGNIPEKLIDRNVRIDYEKLRHLIIIDKLTQNTVKKTTNGNFSRLKDIIENQGTASTLAESFSLEKITAPENFVSLLFYFGLLTIDGKERDKLRFVIPNETAKRLYYDYIKDAYRETDIFDLNLAKYADLYSDLAYDGAWEPLFNFLTGRMRESMSLRDLFTGEKSIQAFLNIYLGLSNLYIVHSEKEMNKGFADIVMEPFLEQYDGIGFSYLLKLKYLKPTKKRPNPGDKKIKELISAAENQLKSYGIDKKFEKTVKKTTLIRLVLIFSGSDCIYLDKV